MTKVISRSAHAALEVLGLRVAAARRERRWTAESLAERAGVSPMTLRKIERGDPGVAVGTVFEVATLVGVELWESGRAGLDDVAGSVRDRLSLLPKRVRTRDVDDDF